MVPLLLDAISCSFQKDKNILDQVSLSLAPGEFFCLLGPSGCGKSTLLRTIAGYVSPSKGKVWINELDVTLLPPEKRNTGMVFQNYALFPHLTAIENVAFGLRMKGIPKKARDNKAIEMLTWVGLSKSESIRYPHQLSGGQQQRVALARALAFSPALLMLDEPFANLDRVLRERLREETRQLQRQSNITTIFVTHDREEALTLSDRIGIMDQGRLLQIGTPEDIFRCPQSTKAAHILGHRNIFPISSHLGQYLLKEHLLTRANQHTHFMLWAEHLSLSGHHEDLPAQLIEIKFSGHQRILKLATRANEIIELHQDASRPFPGLHRQVNISIPPKAVTPLTA